MSNKKHRIHPAVLHAQDRLVKSNISRREFLKLATLLGVSAPTAYIMAACGPASTQVPPTSTVVTLPTSAAPVSQIKRGGIMKWAAYIQPVAQPAAISWGATAHIVGQVAERLTRPGLDGITLPVLLDRWEANDTVDEWTLYLRKNIKFHHGKDLTADDVIFTMGSWLNEETGSSMLGLMGDYLSINNIEKADDFTIKLHLTRPEIGVPEHLLHYPALIMPTDFEGDWQKQPYGTGPFELEEWIVGERVKMKAFKGYWQTGEDGSPLPYLESAEAYDLGDERSAIIAAFESGQIYTNAEPKVEDVLALKDNSSINIEPRAVAQTACLRMRADLEPWSDNRVRKALRLCQRRQALLDTCIFGEGEIGADTHTMNVHPEYCPKDPPPYDPELAKELLAEAGFKDGLDMEIAISAGFPATVSYAETVKADAEAAGFRIKVNSMPGSEYWNVWTEVPVGITEWGARPLGTMVFNLAYTSDADGNPVAWNESHWVDKEFDELLRKANGTLDVEQRRAIMCQLQDIQIERGSVGIAYFSNIWRITNKIVKNMPADPMQYERFNDVWLDE